MSNVIRVIENGLDELGIFNTYFYMFFGSRINMLISIEVEIPDGEYCNQPCQTGCQFLKGQGSIGQCFCTLHKQYLENKSGDYSTCGANIKCPPCMNYLYVTMTRC